MKFFAIGDDKGRSWEVRQGKVVDGVFVVSEQQRPMTVAEMDEFRRVLNKAGDSVEGLTTLESGALMAQLVLIQQ